MMAEAIEQMLGRRQAAADADRPLTMDEEMQQLTMGVIGPAMFSIDLAHELTDVGRAFQEAFDFIFTPSMSQGSLPFS